MLMGKRRKSMVMITRIFLPSRSYRNRRLVHFPHVGMRSILRSISANLFGDKSRVAATFSATLRRRHSHGAKSRRLQARRVRQGTRSGPEGEKGRRHSAYRFQTHPFHMSLNTSRRLSSWNMSSRTSCHCSTIWRKTSKIPFGC